MDKTDEKSIKMLMDIGAELWKNDREKIELFLRNIIDERFGNKN